MVVSRRHHKSADIARNFGIRRRAAYVSGMIQLPPAFAVSCTGGRWFAVAPSNWSLAAGQTFERQELRAVDSGSLVTGDVSSTTVRRDDDRYPHHQA
jgi:hypothetical protein